MFFLNKGERGLTMSVVAVVVTYNRCAMLQQCISHIEAQTHPCDILVIDNASDDQTAEWLQSYQKTHAHIRACRLATNTGGAGGFYHGIRESVHAGYSHVWIMDDDCLPEPEVTSAGCDHPSVFSWFLLPSED